MNKYLVLLFIFFVIIYVYIIMIPDVNKICEQNEIKQIYPKIEETNLTSIY